MDSMFSYARAFNQNISNCMGYMFLDAYVFNGAISSWKASSVTDMRYMFFHARVFNQNISDWDVSSVTNFDLIFDQCDAFNYSLCWNVTDDEATVIRTSRTREISINIFGSCAISGSPSSSPSSSPSTSPSSLPSNSPSS